MLDNAAADVERIDIQWDAISRGCAPTDGSDTVSPPGGCYDWSSLDNAVADSAGALAPVGRKRKVVVFSVRSVPCWLFRKEIEKGTQQPDPCANSYYNTSQNNLDGYVGPAGSKKFQQALESFMALLYQRYYVKSAGDHGPPVFNWTIWNEPNGPRFFHVGATPTDTTATIKQNALQYARAFNFVRRHAFPKDTQRKAAATIAFGPLNGGKPFAQFFHTAVKALNVAPDVVAINAYPDTSGEKAYAQDEQSREGPWARLTAVSALASDMDVIGATRRKPIWVTETSWDADPEFGLKRGNESIDSGETPYTNLVQARNVMATMARFFVDGGPTHRVKLVSWYPLVNGADSFVHSGLLDRGQKGAFAGGPSKPALFAYQAPITVIPPAENGGDYGLWAYYHHGNAATDIKVKGKTMTPTIVVSFTCQNRTKAGDPSYRRYRWQSVTNAFHVRASHPEPGMTQVNIPPGTMVHVAGVKRPRPFLKTTFCATQEVPKAPGKTLSVVLNVQSKYHHTSPSNPHWPNKVAPGFRMVFPAIGTNAHSTRDLDNPHGYVWVPKDVDGSDPCTPGDTDTQTACRLVAPATNVKLFAAPLTSLSSPTDSAVVASSLSGSTYVDAVTVPGSPETNDEPAEPASSVQRVWFNPNEAGSVSISLASDPALSDWTDAYFPPLETSGWNTNAGNPDNADTADGDDPGYYGDPTTGATADQIYSFTPGAKVPDDVDFPTQAIGDWSDNTAVTFAKDAAAPTGLSISAGPRFDGQLDAASSYGLTRVLFNAGADAGVGIDSWHLERRVGMTIGAAAGTDGKPGCSGLTTAPWTQVGSEDPASPFVDERPAAALDGRCGEYRVVVDDRVDNEATATSGIVFWDYTAPMTGGFTEGDVVSSAQIRPIATSKTTLYVDFGVDADATAGAPNDTGIVQREIDRSQTTYRTDGSCDTARWSAYSMLGAVTRRSGDGWSYTDRGLQDATCYRYRLVQVDRAGNTSASPLSERPVDISTPGMLPFDAVRVVQVDLQNPVLTPSMGSPARAANVYAATPTDLWISTLYGPATFTISAREPDDLYARSGIHDATLPTIPNRGPGAEQPWGVGGDFTGAALAVAGGLSVSYTAPEGAVLKRNQTQYVSRATSRAQSDRSKTSVELASQTTAHLRVRVDDVVPQHLRVSALPSVTTDATARVSIKVPKDRQSGLAEYHLERREAPVDAPGQHYPLDATCEESWSDWTQIGPSDPGASFIDRRLASDACYEYRLVATDHVANRAVTAETQYVMSDNKPPEARVSVPTTNDSGWVASAPRATLVGTDSGTGVRKESLSIASAPFADGSCGAFGAYRLVSPDASLGDRQVNTSLQLSDLRQAHCYRLEAVATDRAGNTAAPQFSNTFKTDFLPPTVTQTITPLTDRSHLYVAAPDTVYVNNATSTPSFSVSIGAVSSLSGVGNVAFPAVMFGSFVPLHPTITDTSAPFTNTYI